MFGINLDLDISIVVGFLVVTLIVGMGHGRHIKTIEDYALGGRNFSTAALVATIVATWASGSGFFITMSNTYSDGLYFIIAVMGMGISFLIEAAFIVPRMGEFLGKVSIAEAMGDLYGKEVRIITAVAGTIGAAGMISVQFKVFGNMFSYFLHMPNYVAIISAGFIATLYSAFGGIRAVTFTDILQFVAFGMIIPMIGFIIWSQFYYEGLSFTEAVSDPKFDLSVLFDPSNPKLIGMVIMFCYFCIPSMSAPAFQRVAIGRNVAQVKKAFLISGICLIVIYMIIAWIPFLVYSMNPNLETTHLLGYIVDTYSYAGLKGLIIVAVIALAMSTADSRINAASVLFTNDICKVIVGDLKRELLISRSFAFVLGIGSIILALSETNLIGIVVFANSFYYPVVTPLFLLTVFGFRSSSKAVLIGMGAGFVTTVLWKVLPIEFSYFSQKMAGVLFAMLMNAVFLMGSHYLLSQKGGWVGIKDRTYIDMQKALRAERIATFINKVRNFNPVESIRKIPLAGESTYVTIGVYFLIFTFTTIYSTHMEMLKENGKMITTIYQIMMISGTMMGMYPIWPLSIKQATKEMAIRIWCPIAIFYMLIFLSTFFVLVNKVNNLHFVMFAVNMIVSVVLLGWQVASAMIVVGAYMAVQFYKYYAGVEYLDTSIGSPQFILLYSLVFIGTTLIIFFKPKQERLEQSEQKVDTLSYAIGDLTSKVTGLNEEVSHYSMRVSNHEKEIERLGGTAQRIINNLNHELRLPVGNVVNFAEMLHDGLGKFSQDQLKEISKEVYQNSSRLSSMILNMLDLATLSAKKIELNKKEIDFSRMVTERVHACRNIYAGDKPLEFKLEIQPGIIAVVDENYLRQTIDNLLINAINFSEKGVITTILSRKKNLVSLVIQDQGLGIPKSEIYDIFTPFKMGSNMETKAEGRGIGLALCKAAINAHGGEINAESQEVGTLFKVTLPLD
ncbi:MAG: hypothetical protein COA94_06420 [Rickettsiales bacterium]|nr:MAG: hypothetical protein COA94_06420 [Rickettsiales bacterium]